MAKKKPVQITNPDLEKSILNSDTILNSSIDRHQTYLNNAIIDLEKQIVDLVSELKSEGGQLLSLKHNFKNAQKIHKELVNNFETLYGKSRNVLKDYSAIEKDINEYYKKFAGLRSFGDTDMEAILALKNYSFARFQAFGEEYLEKITQEMYNQILARGSFSSLTNAISGILTGRLDKRGKPMTQYAELWANDELMNFQNQLHLIKAGQAGLDSFLYYGDVIATTRDFCAARAMKVYTKDQINSWKYQWVGKSGPALTHRGGWNCRHHWTPVDPDWGLGEVGGTPADVPAPAPAPPEPKPVKKTTKITPTPTPVSTVPGEFVPAKTQGELNKKFKELNMGYPIGEGYSRADTVRIGNIYAEHFEDMFARFPRLKALSEKRKLYNFYMYNSNYINPKSGTLATYNWSNNTIKVSARRRGTNNIHVGGKWHVADGKFADARHEYGHHVGITILSNEENKPLWNYYKSLYDKGGKPAIKKVLSEYGATNFKEFFAESFSAYTSPVYERGMLPPEIESFYDNLFGEVKK